MRAVGALFLALLACSATADLLGLEERLFTAVESRLSGGVTGDVMQEIMDLLKQVETAIKMCKGFRPEGWDAATAMAGMRELFCDSVGWIARGGRGVDIAGIADTGFPIVCSDGEEVSRGGEEEGASFAGPDQGS